MGKRSREVSFSPAAQESTSQRQADDPSDVELEPPHKLSAERSPSPASEGAMRCSLPPHRDVVVLATFDAFQVHYAKEHTNRCGSCGKNFPSSHMLNLHIEENHDSIREALQARGEKTYGCFVEGCDRKCSTPQKRRLHLIDKHAFPRVYNFRVVDTGIDKSTTLLRDGQRRRISTSADPIQSLGPRRRNSSSVTSNVDKTSHNAVCSSASSESAKLAQSGHGDSEPTSFKCRQNTDETEDDVAELERSMSALRFIPPSVAARQAKKK